MSGRKRSLVLWRKDGLGRERGLREGKGREYGVLVHPSHWLKKGSTVDLKSETFEGKEAPKHPFSHLLLHLLSGSLTSAFLLSFSPLPISRMAALDMRKQSGKSKA